MCSQACAVVRTFRMKMTKKTTEGIKLNTTFKNSWKDRMEDGILILFLVIMHRLDSYLIPLHLYPCKAHIWYRKSEIILSPLNFQSTLILVLI